MKNLSNIRNTTLILATLGMLTIGSAEHTYAQNNALAQAQAPAAALRPAQIFLSGYSAIEEAEKLENAKLYKQAWNKYHQALRSYKSLSQNFPKWKIEIVNSRISRTTEAIQRVEPKAQLEQKEKQNRLKNFIQENTSENGISSVKLLEQNNNKQPIQQLAPRDQKRLSQLLDSIKLYQQRIAKIETQRKAEKERHHKEVSLLTDKLRKAQQGLGGNDNTQTKILNSQIDRLQQKLIESDNRSKDQISKMLALHNELTRKRDLLASAPLRKDVEELEREKLRYEAELEQVVGMHKRHLTEFKKVKKERDEATADLLLAKGALDEKTKLLDSSKNASNKVITSLRNTIREQQSQISSLEQQVVALNLSNDELKDKLDQTNLLNQELKDELASTTLERDKLSQLLNLSDADKVKRTIKEAFRLGEEVRKQQSIIKQLIDDKNASQDEILVWQNKLAVAKQKIINLEGENTDYIRRISSLENSLNNTNTKLSNSLNNPNASPLEKEEAIELKKALKRLTVKLERKKQAEEILWKEYQKSGEQGSQLGFSIANLIQDKITLTAAEKKLLQDKQDTDKFRLPGVKPKSPAQRQAAIARTNSQIQSLESLALRFVEKDQLETAKEIYDEAYDAHGEHYPFFINRGVVRYNLNEFSDAEEIFESGTQLKENSPYTHYMLGVCRYENQKDEQAKKSLQQAIKLKPDYVDAYLYLGAISYSQGDLPKAQEHYQKAVRINPQDSKAQYNLSYIFYERGDKKSAIKTYNNALKSGLAPILEYEKQIGIDKVN